MIVQDQHIELPDRTELIRQLADALDEAGDSGSLVAVVTLKILHLKDVSIEYGYAQSDIVGETFVERLADCLRSKDYLSRISRDEFAVMLPNVKSQAQPIMAINKIQRACAVPININGEEIKLQLCFGWSVGPEDAEDADKLLRCADVALVEAESTGTDSVRYTASGVVENRRYCSWVRASKPRSKRVKSRPTTNRLSISRPENSPVSKVSRANELSRSRYSTTIRAVSSGASYSVRTQASNTNH